MALIEMTESELQAGAMAARAARKIAEADAEKQGNPGVRKTFEETAARYKALAEKFERARQGK